MQNHGELALLAAIESGAPVATNAAQAAELERLNGAKHAGKVFRSSSDSGIVVRENEMGGLSVTFAGRATIEYPAKHFDNHEHLLSLVALAVQHGRCEGLSSACRTIGGAA